MMRGSTLVLLGALATAGCAGEDPGDLALETHDGGTPRDAGAIDTSGLPYATAVVDFVPGRGAGFGADAMPGVVLGPPVGLGTTAGSMDVVSLGVGGEIVVSFGENTIADGEGPDFVVFENAFWVNGDSTVIFAEPGEVSVSEDGVTWTTFACDRSNLDAPWPGCAGWRPTLEFDPRNLPLDPAASGGDPFDLADVGLARARYVRIRDLSTDGESPIAGFDLDAVGIIHVE